MKGKGGRALFPGGPIVRTGLPNVFDLNQQLIMLAVSQLGQDAYGSAIYGWILERLKDVEVNQRQPATVYTTLKRLAQQGNLAIKIRPSPGNTGHDVATYLLTKAGEKKLTRSSVFYNWLAGLKDGLTTAPEEVWE